jgi:hypothetical protein
MAFVDTPDFKTGFWIGLGIILALVVVSIGMSLYQRGRLAM